MPILFFALVWLAVMHSANASTNAIFQKDGQKAAVLLLGLPGDPDPSGFYEALKIPPEDFQGKWAKRLSLVAEDGGKAFDVACIFSKVIQNSGNCSVIFYASSHVSVSRSEGHARLLLSGEQAARFAEAFVVPSEGGAVYRSQDGRLNVSAILDQGAVTQFVVDWSGRGRP